LGKWAGGRVELPDTAIFSRVLYQLS